LLVAHHVNGLVSGKIVRKTRYFMGKSMVSGFGFPLNQSIEHKDYGNKIYPLGI